MKRYSPMKWIKICNIAIEFGLIFLVIFTPLAFGATKVWAYSSMEFVIFVLSTVWILKILIYKNSNLRNEFCDLSKSPSEGPINTEITPSHQLRKSSFGLKLLYFPIISFFLLGIFQLVPLPSKAIKLLSPNTYELYSLTLPNYGEKDQENSAVGKSPRSSYLDSIKNTTLYSDYRTLSITPSSTKRILLKTLAYTTVFFLIINNFTFFDKSKVFHSNRKGIRKSNNPHRSRIGRTSNFHYYIPINRLINTIVATGFLVATLGILQKLSHAKKLFWVFDLPATASPFGSFVNRNNFAGYVNMIIPIVLAIFISKQQFLYPRKSSEHSFAARIRKFMLSLEPWLKDNAMTLLSGIIMISALVFSTSRGGIISLTCCLCIFYIMYLLGCGLKSNLRSNLIVLILLTAVIGISLLWSNPYPLLNRLLKLEDFSRYIELANRVHAYEAALKMVNDFPWFGAGMGAFPNLFFKYRNVKIAEGNSIYITAHSDYLQLAAEAGFLGLAIIILFIIFYLASALIKYCREERVSMCIMSSGAIASISTMLIHSFFGFNIQNPANAMLFAIILGFAHLILNNNE